MRLAPAALVVLAVSPAAAETATSVGSACEVRFVRAPDDVRHVIESWLAAEPHCQSSIDLRVIQVADGYYLLAQRPDGRIHERVVPDAQSAGVLVASWVADDWTAEPPLPPPRPIVAAPRPVIVNPFVGPENQLGASAAPGRVGTRWVSLAGMVRSGGTGGGIRTEIDIYKRGKWSISGALAVSTVTEETHYADATLGLMSTEDIKAVLLLNRTSTFGRWELRAGVGLGVMHTSSGVAPVSFGERAEPWPYDINSLKGIDEETPVGELALSLSRRFATNWSVTGGAVLTISDQDLLTRDPGGWDSEMTVEHRDPELMFTGGLRYAL